MPGLRTPLLVVLAGLLASASSQAQFFEPSTSLLPEGAHHSRVAIHGDLDGDGDLDLVVSHHGAELVVATYLNDGEGVLRRGSDVPLPAGRAAQGFALADVDGDGDLDLAVAVIAGLSGDRNRLFRNDGTGRFTDVTTTALPDVRDPSAAVLFVDVDGDGDPDLVVANTWIHHPLESRQNHLHLNDGSGTFTQVTLTHFPPDLDSSVSVSAGDVDGDGDLDLVFANVGSSRGGRSEDSVYLNDGTGRFSDHSAALLFAPAETTRHVQLRDVDGDGIVDLVAATVSGGRLYLGDGTGRLNEVTNTHLPSLGASPHVSIGDLDGDGDLDLVFAQGDASPVALERCRALANDGSGRFTDTTASTLPPRRAVTVVTRLADFDGDGHLDLFLGNGAPSSGNTLFVNDGTGRLLDLEPPGFPRDEDDTREILLLDVDGDGDLDLFTANAGGTRNPTGGPNRLLRNDGWGRFLDVTATALPPANDVSLTAVAADFDGDGDQDLLIGNQGQDRLLLNRGGVFLDVTAASLPANTSTTQAFAVHDFDGDGLLDVFVAHGWFDEWTRQERGEPNRLYRNVGTGFVDVSAVALPADGDVTTAIALGDVDGDGDADLVLGSVNGPLRLYRNQGGGLFVDDSAASLPGAIDFVQALALLDVDGDGDLDLVRGRGLTNTRLPADVWWNDGAGRFAPPPTPRLPARWAATSAVLAADLDGDGLQDLLFGYHLPPGVATEFHYVGFLRNDGNGSFVEASAGFFPLGGSRTGSFALGDVDRDGDLDLAVGRELDTNALWRNQERHLHAPLPARRGFTHVLRAFARPGRHAGSTTVFPFLNLTALDPPLPLTGLGHLGVDPNGVLILPSATITNAAGTVDVRLHLPRDPRAIGLSLVQQAVFAPSPSPATWSLSNLVTSPIAN